LVLKVLKVLRVQPDTWDPKELKVHRELKVPKVLRVT
jgi:hypothetical protein